MTTPIKTMRELEQECEALSASMDPMTGATEAVTPDRCHQCFGRGYVLTDGEPGWEESAQSRPCPNGCKAIRSLLPKEEGN